MYKTLFDYANLFSYSVKNSPDNITPGDTCKRENKSNNDILLDPDRDIQGRIYQQLDAKANQ